MWWVGTRGLDGVHPLQWPELRSSNGLLTDEAWESLSCPKSIGSIGGNTIF